MARRPEAAGTTPAAEMTFDPEATYEVTFSKMIQHPEYPRMKFSPARSYPEVKGKILEAIKEAIANAKVTGGAAGG